MTQTQQPQPSRKEMERVLAQRFGYEDYETFRQGVVNSIGKGGLKKLEKELDKYGPPETN